MLSPVAVARLVFSFLFNIGGELITNAVLVSGVQ